MLKLFNWNRTNNTNGSKNQHILDEIQGFDTANHPVLSYSDREKSPVGPINLIFAAHSTADGRCNEINRRLEQIAEEERKLKVELAAYQELKAVADKYVPLMSYTPQPK